MPYHEKVDNILALVLKVAYGDISRYFSLYAMS